MILLHEKPALYAIAGPLQLELQPEQVRLAAAEAQIVVDDPLVALGH